ncbi:Trp biosynthesis-associated membrane protein [uncultured Microbacterium sp.]|uniref:Trp biosynthesis-associated membrane protein n=1 Tax=uncultured Microbacterium sp. TaxID=191216 RepID=UPI002630BD81|nr:Trp biosynthesis-associated membrane protein [uncultured Microbacterium sp.]
MSILRRARSITVAGFLLAGGIGIISSTQTWLTVVRADAGEAILVPGADAIVLLAPLSLAVLALGAAMSLVGTVLRLIFAALALATGGLLGVWTVQLLIDVPLSAVASVVTETTGLAGTTALEMMIAEITASAWPMIALAGWIVLIIAALFALITGAHWKRGGRRFRTDAAPPATTTGPVDAVDSWDDLTRGTDPTR